MSENSEIRSGILTNTTDGSQTTIRNNKGSQGIIGQQMPQTNLSHSLAYLVVSHDGIPGGWEHLGANHGGAVTSYGRSQKGAAISW